MNRPVAITKIVNTVYCEQKVVFDNIYGDKKDLSDPEQYRVALKAQLGTEAHKAFEHQGNTILANGGKVTDKRCFVASFAFGQDAPETNWLRHWRDTTLLQKPGGALFVRLYYWLSPKIIKIIEHRPHAVSAITWTVLKFMRIVGYKK